MKEDFLVIDHNGILRVLFLKCNTLLKLQEYSNSKKNTKKIENKDISKIRINKKPEDIQPVDSVLKENVNINTILDKKGNDVNIDIISPQEGNMVTIELKENVGELENKINNHENNNIENDEDDEEKKANAKCIAGCNSCNDGCNLMLTGLNYICDCIGYYFNKMCDKINRIVN